ncbi:MAG: DNA topoisomerase VI subunit B [Candidatus Baldrarchaeia archaeon]
MGKRARGVIKKGTIAGFMRKRTQLVGFDMGLNKHMQYVAEFLDNSLDAIEALYWENSSSYFLDENSIELLDACVRRVKEYLGDGNSPVDLYEPRSSRDIVAEVKSFLEPITPLLDDREPVVYIRLREVKKPPFLDDKQHQRYKMYELTVFDNGVGMVPEDVKMYGIYLASSKSERLRQTRGSQGFGAPSAFSDAQMTTGKPIIVASKHYTLDYGSVEVFFTTQENMKQYIIKSHRISLPFEHGTYVRLFYLNIPYKRGYADTYVKLTSLMNPHVSIIFVDPYGDIHAYPRRELEFPPEPKYTKPHPASITIGELQDLLRGTKSSTLLSFLTRTFVRISDERAKKIIEETARELKEKGLPPVDSSTDPKTLSKEQIEVLFRVMSSQKYISPPKDTVVPVGADVLKRIVGEFLQPEFVEAVTRPPTSGKGLSYVVEACIAYGGKVEVATSPSNVLWRFVNRTPKLRDSSDCAIWKAVTSVNWKNYKLDVFENGMPKGPIKIIVHIAGPFVHLMFKGQSKQALAEDENLIKEIKLTLEEVGRKLRAYISGKEQAERRAMRASVLTSFADKFVKSLVKILETDERLGNNVSVEELINRMKSVIE